MCGGYVFRYVGFYVGLGQVMAAQRSLRRLLMTILVGLILLDYLVYCLFRFAYCLLRFAKSMRIHNSGFMTMVNGGAYVQTSKCF